MILLSYAEYCNLWLVLPNMVEEVFFWHSQILRALILVCKQCMFVHSIASIKIETCELSENHHTFESFEIATILGLGSVI
jgi:hypothetical protein